MFDPMMADHPALPPMRSPDSPPHAHGVDALVARNNQLKTRVAELELVNDLFRGRVAQLETLEANARQAEVSRRELEAQLRMALEAAGRREDGLKRRVEELERAAGDDDDRERCRKKVKVSDLTQ